MAKIKILIGITLSEMGGAQKVVFDIISSLPSQIYDITLVTKPGGELIGWIKDLRGYRDGRIKIIEIPELRREISPIYDIRTFYKLYKILRTGNYHIVHFHSSKMGILGRLAAYMARIPKILFTIHGWGINEYQPRLVQKILGFSERIAGQLCTGCLCVSNYHMEIGLHKRWLSPNKSKVIYNGIDLPSNRERKLRTELKIDGYEPILGTVMRLREPKEPLFTIRVFKGILERGYKARLVIIGDGPMYGDCIKLINRLGIENRVTMLGTREDARQLINDIDIFTMFSRWEGLPISIIEAMMAAKPVVVSCVGGIPELINDGVDGFLLKELNIEQGVQLVETLLKQPSMAIDMGKKAGQEAKKRFPKIRMVEEYDRVYRGL